MNRMPRLTLALATLALAVVSTKVPAQSDPYGKLIGTWSVDSMNGVNDVGMPKSQTLTLSHEGTAAIRVLAVTVDSTGRSTLDLLCSGASKGATRDIGSGEIARCTFRPTPDSVVYTLVIRKNGQTIASEQGRLVVSRSGSQLRDEYYAPMPSGQPGHYRHIYTKK